MAQQGSIPSFGTLNGISADPSVLVIDGSVATTFAILYNYYDSTLLVDNAVDLTNTSAAVVRLEPYSDAGNNNASFELHNTDNNATFHQDSFMNLFYTTNAGYFNINPTNVNNPSVCLSSQSYASSNSLSGTSNTFSLYQYLLKAYCNQKGITVNDISSRILMLLQKECFIYQSLANVKGSAISLSWDELISNLVASGIMFPATQADIDLATAAALPIATAANVAAATANVLIPPYPEDTYGNVIVESNEFQALERSLVSALIPLQLVFKFHSFVLNFDLDIIFTYNVPIGGYLLPTVPSALSSATYSN
jgi:hypothetical protein